MKSKLSVMISCLFLIACSENIASEDVASVPEIRTDTVVKPNISGNWEYWVNKDEMRETETYFAETKSSNTINIGQPYEDVRLTLFFSKDESRDYPVGQLILSNGQFNCSSYNGCKISYKLDDSEVTTMSALSVPGSPTLILGCTEQEIERYGKNVICELRNIVLLGTIEPAKKAIFEVDIFDYGKAQFKFDVSGLKPVEEWKDAVIE